MQLVSSIPTSFIFKKVEEEKDEIKQEAIANDKKLSLVLSSNKDVNPSYFYANDALDFTSLSIDSDVLETSFTRF